MSVSPKPSMGPHQAAGNPGDVDELLRSFFRAQVPASWPAPALELGAGDSPAPPRRAHVLRRSRWALAATILVLLFGSALLTRQFPLESPPAADRSSSPQIGARSGPGTSSPPTVKQPGDPGVSRNPQR